MQQSYKKDAVISATGILLIALFILFTNPTSLPAALLLVLPSLVLITSYLGIKLVLQIFTQLPEARVKFLSAVICAGPTLMILLGSLGQLGFQDIALAVLLIFGMSWYVKRVQGVSLTSL